MTQIRGSTHDTTTTSFQIGTGLFILLGFAALAYLATQTTSVANFRQGPSYTLKARFTNIGQLKLRAPVKIAGVRIGSVSAIDLDPTSSMRWCSSRSTSAHKIPGRFRGRDIHQWFIGRPVRCDAARRLAGHVQGRRRVVLTQSSIQLEDLIGKFLVGGDGQGGRQERAARSATTGRAKPADKRNLRRRNPMPDNAIGKFSSR